MKDLDFYKLGSQFERAHRKGDNFRITGYMHPHCFPMGVDIKSWSSDDQGEHDLRFRVLERYHDQLSDGGLFRPLNGELDRKLDLLVKRRFSRKTNLREPINPSDSFGVTSLPRSAFARLPCVIRATSRGRLTSARRRPQAVILLGTAQPASQ